MVIIYIISEVGEGVVCKLVGQVPREWSLMADGPEFESLLCYLSTLRFLRNSETSSIKQEAILTLRSY